MTVLEMVREHLCANDFDGLVQPDAQCGCGLHDLAPCGEIGGSCLAAYRVKPTPEQMDEWGIEEGDEWYSTDASRRVKPQAGEE